MIFTAGPQYRIAERAQAFTSQETEMPFQHHDGASS